MIRTLLRHCALFFLSACFMFCSTVSDAAITQPSSVMMAPAPILNPVEETSSLPNQVTSSQFGLDLPLSVGLQYIQGSGLVGNAQYTKLVNQHWAGSILAEYGANLYRVNGTVGLLIGASNLFKVTLERLSENLPFQFDSGNINQRVGQNAVGARYQAGFNNSLIQAINAGTYYARAESISLPSISYISNGLSYTNYRNIAGSKSGGADVGIVSSLTSTTQFSTNLYYDQINYDNQLTSPQYNSSGLGVSAGLAQIITPRLKLVANAETRKIYDSCQIALAFLPKQFSKYDVQLSLAAGRFIPHNGQSSSNSVGVQVGFSFEPEKGTVTNAHYALSNPAIADLKTWTSTPAVYMEQVLAVGEQKTVLTVPSISSISPSHGPTGTVVTINGAGFTAVSGASGVQFGGVDATSYTVNSDTSITATVPSGTLGTTVDVTVTGPGGTGTLSNGYTYSLTAEAVMVKPGMLGTSPPTVTGVSPNHGSAGTPGITISGSGFSASLPTIKFGTQQANTFTVANDSSIINVTAPSSNNGTVDVTVTTTNGTSATSSADQFTYPASISSFTPTSGDINGGTTVVITGTGFSSVSGATGVQFGSGNNATSYSVDSNTQITAVTPAHSAGTVNILVVNTGGTATSSGTYQFGPAPSISSVSPNSGSAAGSTSVTITGSGFTGVTGASGVKFGSNNASSYVVNSNNSITATSPAGSPGVVNIVVTNPGDIASNIVSADQFTYLPAVTSVLPTTGTTAGGTSVTISGSGFTGASDVKFGTSSASFVVNSNNSITATSPAGSAGTVDITVINNSQTSTTSSNDQFTYVTPPTVSSVSPTSGSAAGGTSVTVSGSGFTGVTGAAGVKFGSNNASSYSVTDDSTITATSPAGSPGVVDITVTNNGVTSTTSSSDQFTYKPAITSVSPTSGTAAGGTSVTISGAGFTGTSGAGGVKFGANNASSYNVVDNNTITATSPSGSAGTVDITVTNNSETSPTSASDQFTYDTTPTVTGVSPSSGPAAGGTSVTITGTGFLTTSAVNFGASSASFVVDSDTQITATSPAHAAGTIDITVTNTTGTSSTGSADHFTYDTTPTVSAVSPSSGPAAGGSSVTITGTGFLTTSAVNFGASSASFVVNSDTQITATSPAHSAGTIHITVTNTTGTSSTSSADQFTYDTTPTVSAVSPSSGAAAGGTSVTITGTGFLTTSAVNFGASSASFVVNSDTQITATSPAHSAGTIHITVTNTTGTSSTSSADQFTYDTTPTVTAVSPSSGSSAGGTSVTITGTGFLTTTAVKFAASAATSYTINSDTQITATSPAHALGTVDITVTNSTGTSSTSSADEFTYASVPVVSSVAPNTGQTTGGVSVTITGSTFTDATGVQFGSNPASSFTVNSDSSITAISPAGSAGVVDIRVTNDSGTSNITSADQYTYIAPNTTTTTVQNNLNGGISLLSDANSSIGSSILVVQAPTTTAISSLTPAAGSMDGGSEIIIKGNNFNSAHAIYFGGKKVTKFTVVNNHTIKLTTPAHAAGTVDIKVITSTGSAKLEDGFNYN